jgi:hypothetical protein
MSFSPHFADRGGDRGHANLAPRLFVAQANAWATAISRNEFDAGHFKGRAQSTAYLF